MHSHQFNTKTTDPAETPNRINMADRMPTSDGPSTASTSQADPRPTSSHPLLPIHRPISSVSQAPPLPSSSSLHALPSATLGPVLSTGNLNQQVATGAGHRPAPPARPLQVHGPSWFKLWWQGKDEDEYWWEMGWIEAQCSSTLYCQCARCIVERRRGLRWRWWGAVWAIFWGILAVGMLVLVGRKRGWWS